MKAALLGILISASFITAYPDDACCENPAATVESKLRMIDLNIALKKYEQLQGEKAKAEIRLALTQASFDADSEERDRTIKGLTAMIDVLAERTAELRKQILTLGKSGDLASVTQ